MKAKTLTRNLNNARHFFHGLRMGRNHYYQRHGARWLCCDWNVGRGQWSKAR